MKKTEKTNEVVKEEKVEVKKEETKPVKTESKSGTGTVVVAVVVILAIIVIGFTFFKIGKQSLKQELETELKAMGEDFYTEFYYPEISKNKSNKEINEFLDKFKDVGVKVNLDNLSRYDSNKNKEKVKKFKNEKGNSCNQTTTQAIIKPKAPYGKKDYTVKVELDCGFTTSQNK